MLRVLGSHRQMCDGVNRRELLQAGGLGACGLGLSQFLALRDAHEIGRASCRERVCYAV